MSVGLSDERLRDYVAEALDLSRLPAFQLVTVDENAERLSLMAGVKARFEARGIPYDVEMLRTDTVAVLVEEVSFRKMLTLGAINDAGKRFTLAYGYGASLDQLAATYYGDLRLARLALVEAPRPFATNPEDWESDERFKLRIALAPQARTPGTLGGYEFWALTAAPHLVDAVAYNHASGLVRPGQILVVVLGRDPDPNPLTAKPAEEEPAQLLLARARLLNRNTKLGSDEVAVEAALRVPAVTNAVLEIRRGADPGLVVAEAGRRQDAYLATRRRVGKRVTLTGLAARLTIEGIVEKVRQLAPAADIDPGPTGVVQITASTITTEAING